MVLFRDIPVRRCRVDAGLVRSPRKNWGRRAYWKLIGCGKRPEELVFSLCRFVWEKENFFFTQKKDPRGKEGLGGNLYK